MKSDIEPALEALGVLSKKLDITTTETSKPAMRYRGDNPKYRPDWRKADHNGVETEDGVLPLHRGTRVNSAHPGLLQEQAWHRMAAYMILHRHSNREVAEAANVTEMQVVTLKSQLWFQQLLAKLASNRGEALSAMIEGAATKAFQNIVDLAEDPEVGARTRLTANQLILEHAVGKPTQKIIQEDRRVTMSPEEEIESVEAQLAAIRQARETAPSTEPIQ